MPGIKLNTKVVKAQIDEFLQVVDQREAYPHLLDSDLLSLALEHVRQFYTLLARHGDIIGKLSFGESQSKEIGAPQKDAREVWERYWKNKCNKLNNSPAIKEMDDVNLGDADIIILTDGSVYQHINLNDIRDNVPYAEDDDPNEFYKIGCTSDIAQTFKGLPDCAVEALSEFNKFNGGFGGDGESCLDIGTYAAYHGFGTYDHPLNTGGFAQVLANCEKQMEKTE